MFVKIKNNTVEQYPYSIQQMRQDYAQTSFPENISTELRESFGVFEVFYQATPEFDATTQQVVTSSIPFLIESKWTLTKTIKQQTPDQIAANTANKAVQVRSQRDKKLVASDWTQVNDAPVDKEAWAVYRQKLRDISSQSGFPWSVTWPDSP